MMVNKKAKKANWKIDPRCCTFSKYLFQKELIKKRMGRKLSPTLKSKRWRGIFPRMRKIISTQKGPMEYSRN